MLAFTQLYLLFLSTLVVYDFIFSSLITLCTYLLVKMPTTRQVQQFIQLGHYTFLLISRMPIYMFLLFNHHFLLFVLQHKPYQWKCLTFGLTAAPRVFTSLIKPMLFLCRCKGFHVNIYLDDILVLTCSKGADKRAQIFFYSFVFVWLHINFSKSEPQPVFGILSTGEHFYVLLA